MAVKLSKRVVDATAPGASRVRVWDSEVSGFGLEVTPSGHKSYVFKYRIGGGRAARVRWAKVGDHGALTPDQARELARAWAAEVAAGRDPGGVKLAGREAPTVAELLDRYLAEHAGPKTKARSSASSQLLVKSILRPALGRLKVAEVTSADIAKLHGALSVTPYQANRALAVLSKAFRLAELWHLRPSQTNPCRDVQRYPEKARKRSLSGEEFARLGEVLAQAEVGPLRIPAAKLGGLERSRTVTSQAVRALRLLIFTGARLGEVLGLRWEFIDLRLGRAVLPDSKTGEKVLQLPPPAVEVLASAGRPEDGRGFIIRGGAGDDPERPLVNLQDAWEAIREAAKLSDIRLHDLRHAFASIAVNDGISLPMIGGLLGHREMKTTQRYAHLAESPQKVAAAQIAGRIADAMKPPRQSDNVVTFPRKK